MRSIVSICVFVLLLEFSESRIYEPCRLAKELYYVHGIERKEIPYWLCHIEELSGYNTAHVSNEYNRFGSGRVIGSYGLLQYHNKSWCGTADELFTFKRYCGPSCSVLSDDNITNDIKCMKNYFRKFDHTSMRAWSRCTSNVPPNMYLHGCNI